jgi:succinate dehydrogenase/fumarate reductase flavoprotein subunit
MQIECDLLVLGAGMAGLCAAAYAAERGANVVILEKTAEIGGSAIFSGGYLWTSSSREGMRAFGRGDERVSDVVLKNFPDAMDWLRSRQVNVSRAMSIFHGMGYEVDLVELLNGCARSVQQAGGHLALETSTQRLITDETGRVTGAHTTHRDGEIRILAKWTLLATGGFQNSPELRAKLIHPAARDMLVRSNLGSAGDAIRLAEAVGAHVSGTNNWFYGHLVSETPVWGDRSLFRTLSQSHSPHSLLINEAGLRFCDETEGYYVNTCHVLRQPDARALLFWDARVQRDFATQSPTATVPSMDKMALALERGGKGIVAHALGDIGAFAAANGFNGNQMIATIQDFNDKAVSAWERLHPSHVEKLRPIDEPPFYALVVKPAITFTYGGLSVGPDAQVMRANGTPVGGLLAAGADVGDAYRDGYGGGLSLALTYGIEAVRTAGFL